MKRFATILFLTFSRWGLIAFSIYYATLYLIILDLFPTGLLYTIAEWVDPYYVTIRYVGIFINVIIFVMVFRFFMKYIQYQSYVIRKKNIIICSSGKYYTANELLLLYKFTSIGNYYYESTNKHTKFLYTI